MYTHICTVNIVKDYIYYNIYTKFKSLRPIFFDIRKSTGTKKLLPMMTFTIFIDVGNKYTNANVTNVRPKKTHVVLKI